MINKITCLTVIALVVNILGCPVIEEKQGPLRNDSGGEAKCRAACEHIGPKGLDCEEGRPIVMKESCNLDGGSRCKAPATCAAGKCVVDCVTFCIETQSSGAGITPECVARVKSCAEIDLCRLAQ